MAVLSTDVNVTGGVGAVPITRTTITSGNNSLTYIPGSGQVLYLFNTGGSAITLTLTGTAPVSPVVPGYGTVDTSTGKVLTVPATSSIILKLDDIGLYLAGTGAVTAVASAVGLNGYLFT